MDLASYLQGPSTADVLGNMPPKPERGMVLPIMREGDRLSPAVPAILHTPYEAAARFVGGRYNPGTQDAHSMSTIENAADVARMFSMPATGGRAAGEALDSVGQQIAKDRTWDALKYHLRQISHDEGGWSSRLGKAAFVSVPTATTGAFYNAILNDSRYGPWVAPAMMGASAATSLLAAGTQLAPHYRMLMNKRDYLRAMDARQAERAAAIVE